MAKNTPITIFEKLDAFLSMHPNEYFDVYDLSVYVNASESSIRKTMSRNKGYFSTKKLSRKTLYSIETLEWRPNVLFPEDLIF